MKDTISLLCPEEYMQRISRLNLTEAQAFSLRMILALPETYIQDKRFENPDNLTDILRLEITCVLGKRLLREQENALFIQLNYTKYRMFQMRQTLLNYLIWQLDQVIPLIDFYRKQQVIRNRIALFNNGLVHTTAKRLLYFGLEYNDLVSEGNIALLRAVDRFDYTREYKFSTYAIKVICRSLYRIAKLNQRYRHHFRAGWDYTLESEEHLCRNFNEFCSDWSEEVRVIMRHNLAHLTEREKAVLKMRFSLNQQDYQPLTLSKVGQRFGLSKERIRQIQNQALKKLSMVIKQQIQAIG